MNHRLSPRTMAIIVTLAAGIAGCGTARMTTTRNATSTPLSVSAYETRIVPKLNRLVSVPQAPLGEARTPSKIRAYAVAACTDFGAAIHVMNSINAPTGAQAPQRQLIVFLRAERTAFQHALAAKPVNTHAIINYAYTHEVGQLTSALYAVTK
jgi:hypothetical protein